jgi:hypothetical protein
VSILKGYADAREMGAVVWMAEQMLSGEAGCGERREKGGASRAFDVVVDVDRTNDGCVNAHVTCTGCRPLECLVAHARGM